MFSQAMHLHSFDCSQTRHFRQKSAYLQHPAEGGGGFLKKQDLNSFSFLEPFGVMISCYKYSAQSMGISKVFKNLSNYALDLIA